jgi:integrase
MIKPPGNLSNKDVAWQLMRQAYLKAAAGPSASNRTPATAARDENSPAGSMAGWGGVPWTEAGFRKMLARTGEAAGFPWPVHPHQLRHACGYKLANDGVDTRCIQAYLGHKNIAHTALYTELAADRFAGLWQDRWPRTGGR